MLPFPDHPSLRLLPEGAVWIGEEHALVVADVHLGKSATFRARGLPVPEGDIALDLARLLELARRWQAQQVIVAGDLFHAPAGFTPELAQALDEFRNDFGNELILVEGNHDRKLKQLPADLRTVQRMRFGCGLEIVHDPEDVPLSESLQLAGHWHPVVRIPDGPHRPMRMPCFVLHQHSLVLPSFGSFTGSSRRQYQPEDRIFVAHRRNVIEIPRNLISRG